MLRSAATLFHYSTIISGHISTAVKILFQILIQSETFNSININTPDRQINHRKKLNINGKMHYPAFMK